MKQLYYDLNKQSWYHNSPNVEENVSLGKYYSVPYKDTHPTDYQPFSFLFDDNKAGPLIGILASPKQEGFIGNIGLFKRIQRSLHQTGGISVVFTPDKLTENGINGYCYLPTHNHWIKMNAPLPDLIYNRLYSYEDEEKHLEHVQNLADLYHIPLFNPQFFDKWELYLQLKSHEELAAHLPHTALLTEEALEEFLFNYPAVYVKKRKSTKGNGVSLIVRNGYTFLLKTTSTKTILFPTIKKLAQYFNKEGTLPSYIVQEAIPTIPFDGKKFDYRILAHLKQKHFVVTGIGVRVAHTQQVTTHVPAGGVIANVDDLPHSIDLTKIERLIKQCGKQLLTFYDALGEFSADLGVTQDGNYYLFELNAKPMDFDEPTIKKASIDRLTNLFYEQTMNQIKDFTH
ncbi:YheC/YheD family endospore coat-associated protein [Sutcliffiella halmapala]|uniref:YheC/YheD family endospore coat-associated protein n=1 Tax=Sutcliffiella halmapala TaxID=79882 RepID=UPI000995D035|nr:YheC/YheD family protein [Sutcliffiella halmapala]